MPIAYGEFIDTNVLVYEWDSSDPSKQAKARQLVKRLAGRGVISSQVAQEFAWTVRRKLKLTADETGLILRNYRIFKFIPIDIRLIERALTTSDSNQISYWDALIIEAAVEAKCKVLLTEDLNHSQLIRGIQIVNPFLR